MAQHTGLPTSERDFGDPVPSPTQVSDRPQVNHESHRRWSRVGGVMLLRTDTNLGCNLRSARPQVSLFLRPHNKICFHTVKIDLFFFCFPFSKPKSETQKTVH